MMSNTLVSLPEPIPDHPAKYSEPLLPIMASMLRGCKRILDPMCGVGTIFLLQNWLPDAKIEGLEIEKKWARAHQRARVGNVLHLPWEENFFDAICVSPPYGNRMADKYVDGTKRNTYRAYYGEELHPDNAGTLQWGKEYREFHEKAWTECLRVLRPGGTFVLNCKDHIRAGKRMHVTQWHIDTLCKLGCVEVKREPVMLPGNQYGANADLRIPYEEVAKLRLSP